MDYMNYVLIALVVILTIVIIWLLSSKGNSSKKTTTDGETNKTGSANWSGSSKKA
ncbi:E18 Occlusion-derived virus envelope protein ODV-E18 [Drosophila suzukii associated hytrosavirus 1]|nr:E18 Occlusion-derived virus envelope protein ODV-E18 [Drosophila suzukii associated hytrosavirus 1]